MIFFKNYFVEFIFVLILCSIKFISSHTTTWNLHGTPGDGYYIAINIGYPPQKFNLLVDTGSSNLAVAGAFYPGVESFFNPNKSTTFQYNGISVKVIYTQGWWKGFTGEDFVSIPSLYYLEPVLIDLSLITKTDGFYVNSSHWQGILGLAYSELAKPHGFVSSWFDSITEVLPNITKQRFDLQLCGPQAALFRSTHFGKFSVGDFNNACSKSEFSTSIEHRWYYEVLITGFKVGQRELEISCSHFNSPKTIIDSGTSNLQLSGKSYYEVIYELKRQTEDRLPHLDDNFWMGKKEKCFDMKQTSDLFPSLTIFLNHNESSHFGIRLPPSAYLRPLLNRTDRECWILGIEKAKIGTVLGTVALEGFCLVFDRRNGEISFAPSNCGPNVSLTPLKIKTDTTPCNYVVHVVNGPLITSIVILLIVLIPVFGALVRSAWLRWVKPTVDSRVPFLSMDETDGV